MIILTQILMHILMLQINLKILKFELHFTSSKINKNKRCIDSFWNSFFWYGKRQITPLETKTVNTFSIRGEDSRVFIIGRTKRGCEFLWKSMINFIASAENYHNARFGPSLRLVSYRHPRRFVNETWLGFL